MNIKEIIQLENFCKETRKMLTQDLIAFAIEINKKDLVYSLKEKGLPDEIIVSSKYYEKAVEKLSIFSIIKKSDKLGENIGLEFKWNEI